MLDQEASVLVKIVLGGNFWCSYQGAGCMTVVQEEYCCYSWLCYQSEGGLPGEMSLQIIF